MSNPFQDPEVAAMTSDKDRNAGGGGGAWGNPAGGAGAWGNSSTAAPSWALPASATASAAASMAGSTQPSPAKKSFFGAFGGAYGVGGGASGDAAGAGMHDVPLDKPQDGASALSSKEAELRRKEAELKAKEAEMAKREAEMIRSGGSAKKKNWPTCYPCLYHDIAGEIPVPARNMVRFVYWSWYGLALCLLMNVACASIVLGKGKSGAVASWFLAIVYLLLGLPLSFFLWYRRLYNGSKADSAFGYLGFFIMYLIHIAFCIWAAVAIPIAASKWSFCGFLSMIRAFDIDAITGFFFLVGASMWTLEAVWSFWCLKSVYGYFRGRGGHEQVRKETLRAAVNASTRV